MKDLVELRTQIDQIDQEILQLFEQRMEVAKGVASYKIATGKPVFDPAREKEKIETLKGKVTGEFNALGVQELFQQIMAISRKLQYQLLKEHDQEEKASFRQVEEIRKAGCKVVFQGVKGAYSYAAMKNFFGEDIESYPVEQWKDAMDMVASGQADYAVLPIENSTAGSVYDNYDLLEQYDHYIVGEQVIKCEHALLGVKGAALSDIRCVYSHPQALMQCRSYLENHMDWKQKEFDNTAGAALKVSRDGKKEQAAIASKVAANCYDLDILEERVFFSDNNSTRFIIVSKDRIFTKQAKKISICFELPHASGSLYNILSHFIYNNLNMTKIESRPVYEKSWEYRFFVDFEGNLNDSAVKNALRGITAEANAVRVFGNY